MNVNKRLFANALNWFVGGELFVIIRRQTWIIIIRLAGMQMRREMAARGVAGVRCDVNQAAGRVGQATLTTPTPTRLRDSGRRRTIQAKGHYRLKHFKQAYMVATPAAH